MNTKKTWSAVCFVIAVGLSWSAYSRLLADDGSWDRAAPLALAALFHVIIGAILWAQGRSQKKPIHSPVPTRGNGT